MQPIWKLTTYFFVFDKSFMWYHHTQDMFTHQRYSTYTLLNPQRPFMLSHHIHLSLFLTLLVLILLVNLALIQKIASKYFVFTSEVFLKILPYILLFWKESIFTFVWLTVSQKCKDKEQYLESIYTWVQKVAVTNVENLHLWGCQQFWAQVYVVYLCSRNMEKVVLCLGELVNQE